MVPVESIDITKMLWNKGLELFPCSRREKQPFSPDLAATRPTQCTLQGRSTVSRVLPLVLLCVSLAPGQRGSRGIAASPGPMLDGGIVTLDTPSFTLKLVRSSQTMAALEPKASPGFDFTPGDLLAGRSQNGYYHLGDLDLRIRTGGADPWKGYSTAFARQPVAALPTTASVLAAADLSPTLPPEVPLRIVRSWLVAGGALVLRFELTNKSTKPVQIGALGIPMVFNNVLTNRSLDQAHAVCSFYDPYIGEDAGYLQVTRLNGKGPALLVTPDGKTPFEAYSPILDSPPGQPRLFADRTPRSVTFEGFMDWMMHTKAYAENEWRNATPWNPPTMATLAPGQSRRYGVRFLLSNSIREIEKTLAAAQRPVAVGLPGYILPMDVEGSLFLKSPRKIASVHAEPRDALSVTRAAAKSGWTRYQVRGRKWGRARLVVTYDDGAVQAIQYMVTKPESEAVADLGRFLTTRQWFVDPKDPFKRSPSIMTYDREEGRIVTQDTRAWIAGLGDEGGSAWLSEAMKLLGQPDPAELAKYQDFIDKVVWGGLQIAEGPQQYAVRKSLFYYEPSLMPAGYYRSDWNWGTWSSWNKKAAYDAVNRSYDYPHVAALYWSMYRLARNYKGLVTNHPWDWYLDHAYQTSLGMVKFAPQYAQYGQMEGTIFLKILRDLQREGWRTQATTLEGKMKARAAVWERLSYPFGSEMPWDSTGQEEVYAWTKYFGNKEKAQVTLDAILAYMPTLPHWGYNGSARRYWDFLYAAKVRRIERQLHHYGSGLNAIPVLSEFRDHPDDLHLLRAGFAGQMGAIANIDAEGFGSAAFHSFPDMLKPDPLSGDYAQNFLGHALNTATYLVNDPEFGWQAFGGNVQAGAGKVVLTPLDSFRQRVYLAPIGLWLTLDAGRFERVELNPKTGAVQLAFDAADAFTPAARLRVEQPAAVNGVGKYGPAGHFEIERDAYLILLHATPTIVDLAAGRR